MLARSRLHHVRETAAAEGAGRGTAEGETLRSGLGRILGKQQSPAFAPFLGETLRPCVYREKMESTKVQSLIFLSS